MLRGPRLPVVISLWIAGGLAAVEFGPLTTYTTIAWVQKDGTRERVPEAVERTGFERLGKTAQQRGYMLSEDQERYPFGESACGPTAALNILVWYCKYGLLDSHIRYNEAKRYLATVFGELDHTLTQSRGVSREYLPGSTAFDIAMMMSQFVEQQSNGELQLHCDLVKSPLEHAHFKGLMEHYRSGILLVDLYEPGSDIYVGGHAVTVLWTDRSGVVSIGTWGQIQRGRLQPRGDQQWFETGNAGDYRMRVLGLLRFVPFKPAAESVAADS